LLHLACWYNQPEILSNFLREFASADLRQMQEARDAVAAI
jgi:hypothetical protein